jgi:transcriptional regulator with XRE-family HTH domain
MGTSSRPKPNRLAKKLLQIREALGLSQTEMLNRLKLDQTLFRSTISAYERGKREPPYPILLLYARVAGVCTDVLIDDELDLPAKVPGVPKHKK